MNLDNLSELDCANLAIDVLAEWIAIHRAVLANRANEAADKVERAEHLLPILRQELVYAVAEWRRLSGRAAG